MTLCESHESTNEVLIENLLKGESPSGFGGPDISQYAQIVIRGGWPSLVTRKSAKPNEFLRSYLDDCARVELKSLDITVNPMRVSALVQAVSRNIATACSASKLAQEAEISPQTARRYIDELSRIHLVDGLPAWSPPLRSKIRLRVSPKWHLCDPSLAAAAMGAGANTLLEDLETFGFLFKSLCIRDLRAYADILGGSVYHYRDGSGLEVDAIVEIYDGSWAAFEIKLGGERAIDQAAHNLQSLKNKVTVKRAEHCTSLTVLTAGNISYRRPDGVNVVSLGHLGSAALS